MLHITMYSIFKTFNTLWRLHTCAPKYSTYSTYEIPLLKNCTGSRGKGQIELSVRSFCTGDQPFTHFNVLLSYWKKIKTTRS